MPRLHRSPAERLAAWMVCGPIGHLLAGVADWGELLATQLLARRRRGAARRADDR